MNLDLDLDMIMHTSIVIISTIGEKEQALREFELLAYEQACRTAECFLREVRETWEKEEDELGNTET